MYAKAWMKENRTSLCRIYFGFVFVEPPNSKH